MKNKTLKLSCGKKIEIYHDIFTLSQREWFMSFAANSSFKTGRISGSGSMFRPGNFFSCLFNAEDDNNFGLSSLEQVIRITKNTPCRSWLNSTITGSWYYTHTDYHSLEVNKRKTLLYNVNMFWDTEHGGETLFYNSYGEKEIAIDFIPGQVIFFDSSLGHRPAVSQGHIEPRFIYVAQYEYRN